MPEESKTRERYQVTVDELADQMKLVGAKRMGLFGKKNLTLEERVQVTGFLSKVGRQIWPFRDRELELLAALIEIWSGMGHPGREIALKIEQEEPEIHKAIARSPETAFASRVWVGGTYLRALARGIEPNREILSIPPTGELEAYILEHSEAHQTRLALMNKLISLMPRLPKYELIPSLIVNWIFSSSLPGCEENTEIQPLFQTFLQALYRMVQRIEQDVL